MFRAQRVGRRSCRLSWHLSLVLLLLCGGGAREAIGQICGSDDTLQFGNQEVGSSTTASVTVSNCGPTPWSFTDVSVDPATGPAFQVHTSCSTGLTLAPGASCSVNVAFAPTTT